MANASLDIDKLTTLSQLHRFAHDRDQPTVIRILRSFYMTTWGGQVDLTERFVVDYKNMQTMNKEETFHHLWNLEQELYHTSKVS